LKTALETLIPSGQTSTSSGATTIQKGYNGMVYIYDNTVNSDGTKNGVVLTNAQATPAVKDTTGSNMGFTVTSDNGLYLQGDYNTVTDTSGNINPAAIMADAVTVLSPGWTISESSGSVGNRYANKAAGDLSTSVYNSMTINSAILTGNTPTTSNNNSGGVQNLIRYLEYWYQTPGSAQATTVTFNGAIGQLFSSKYFNGGYVKSGDALALGLDPVYYQPNTRNITFDSNLATTPPRGTPTTTDFTRGDFFTW